MTVISTYESSGRPVLALLAKRAYRVAGASLSPEAEEPPIRVEAERAPSVNAGALDYTVHESDLFAAARPLCDILVRGSAHAPRGAVKRLDTGVMVGAAKKIVRVWGDRSIVVEGGGRLRFSEAEPFTSMPLSWDHAYGGRDELAERRLFPKRSRFGRPRGDGEPGLIGYPRNPAGRGFYLDMERERLHGVRAPNLEDAEDPVTPDRLLAKSPLDWLDRPTAAGYSPLDVVTFPRAAYFLAPAFTPPARPVREVQSGALNAADLAGRDLWRGKLDTRAAQCAPPGLATAITGRVRLSLWNLWPGREMVEIELPPEVPQLVLEPQGCAPGELRAQLKTVLVEPDQERVVLTWVGVMEVAAGFPPEMCNSMRRAIRWTMRRGGQHDAS